MIRSPFFVSLTDESRAQLPSCWSSIHRDETGLVIRVVPSRMSPDQRRWRQSQGCWSKSSRNGTSLEAHRADKNDRSSRDGESRKSRGRTRDSLIRAATSLIARFNSLLTRKNSLLGRVGNFLVRG